MSVLVSRRRESKLEVIIHAVRLQQEFTKLLQRDFGIRDINAIVRRKYAFGKYVASQKYYGRYMDDWYIISNSKEDLHILLNDIIKIAGELGIHINQKKTHILKVSSTYKYLQIKYQLTDNGRIIKRINPDRITAMRRKLKKLAVKHNNGDIEYAHIENMFKSWMGSFYKLMSKQQRNSLIDLFEGLFNRHVEIVNKKMIINLRG